MTAALILTDEDTVGPLDTFPTTTVLGGNLRPGMILLDDLGTAAAVIDHRNPAPRNSGAAVYLAENLEDGPRYITVTVHARAAITVAAR